MADSYVVYADGKKFGYVKAYDEPQALHRAKVALSANEVKVAYAVTVRKQINQPKKGRVNGKSSSDILGGNGQLHTAPRCDPQEP